MDKTTLIIGAIIIILIILIIMNYKKINRINPQESLEQMQAESHIGDKLVLYYAEWCGISRGFKPTWDAFVKKNGHVMKMEIVDCVKDNQICKVNNIAGYPTIILHKRDGKNVQYNGQRTIDGLEAFCTQNKY